MQFTDFVSRFSSLLGDTGTYSIIDAEHPLYIYGGCNSQRQPTFMLVSNQNVDVRLVQSTQMITVKSFKRKDGSNALSFSFLGKDCSLFFRLCFDMLEATRNAPVEEKYLRLIARYQAWYNMLSRVHPNLLSINQQKGLCGELLYLLKEIDTIGSNNALESWRGPNGGDQDFVNQDSWCEVKSIRLSGESVEISSLEQLSPPIPGVLAVYKIEQTTKVEQDSFSLFSLVQRVEEKISNSPNDILLFKEKLLLYNCDISEQIYRETFFVLKNITFYNVQENFPKLTPELVPSGIVSAHYAINLASIEEYKTR